MENATNTFSWNQFYKTEINNFNHNDEDIGECWFDDSNAEGKVVQFFCDLLENGEISTNLLVCDLGTGNGHFLFELHDSIVENDIDASLGYHGIDYSPDSIELALLIALKKYPNQDFVFEQVDFIAKECPYLERNEEKFDVFFDKGTLDAIALNNNPIEGFDDKIGIEVYPIQVSKMMHQGSLLIITSCNFTEDELEKLITENGKNSLSVWKKIEYPSFQFGGVKGSTICSIAFRKN